MMKSIICTLTFVWVLVSCQSQTKTTTQKIVGGPCEGCEALYEYGDRALTQTDTLPGFGETIPQLRITGTIYEKDGKTPADQVILYIYHTNREGIYEKKEGAIGWAQKHGYIRGWVQTDTDGVYTFYCHVNVLGFSPIRIWRWAKTIKG
ncbi:MAG: hypothetical protein AAFR59_04890, partial [Bacteroidota bacterium]